MQFRPISKETIIITILIVGLLGLYSIDRARLGHSIPDEKRYIQSTKEMVQTGDYITPRYHGRLRFQKPILFYWFIVLSYKIFGVGIFGTRFPSVVAGVLNVILVYLLGRSLFNKKGAIFSALVLSTSEIYFTYSRFAVPDMTFLLFITASIYLFLKAYCGDIKGRFKYMYMFIAMAMAMLTKGPLGFIYPMLTACLFLTLRKDWAVFKEIKFLFGLLVFTAISAPWFISMILMHGDKYIDKVWFLEIAKKLEYFSSGTNSNILLHYFKVGIYYIGMFFARHLPWSIFLPVSLISIKRLTYERIKSDYGLTLIAAHFFTVFITLVLIWSKESYYVLALSVPFSLFTGLYLSRVTEEDNLGREILFKLPFVVAILVNFLALIGWLGFTSYILDKPVFSFSLSMFLVPILILYSYIKKNKTLLIVGFFVAVALSFAYFAGNVIPTIDEESLLRVAEKIKRDIKPGDVIGVASGEISYHRLNVPLQDYIIIRVDKRSIYQDEDKNEPARNEIELINEFLSTKDRRIFCVITKDDYYEFVDKELKDRLYIIDDTFIWRRFHKQDKEYFKRLLSYFLEGKRELLRQALKEEIYLVSNRDI